MILAYTIVLCIVAMGSPQSKQKQSDQPAQYKFDKVQDWSKDTTLSETKRQYCEYLFTKKSE